MTTISAQAVRDALKALETNEPGPDIWVLPAPLYDRWEAEGRNMRNYARQSLIPVGRFPP